MAAATTSVALLLPGFDMQPLAASIVSANEVITTFAVQCAPGSDALDCGFTEPFTMAQGPKTFSMRMDYSDEEYGTSINDIDCKLDASKDTLDCEVYASYSMSDEPEFESSTKTVMTGLSDLMFDVAVTAGLDKLPDSPATTTADDSATATTSSDGQETESASEGDSTATTSSDSQETESASEGGSTTTFASITQTTSDASDATSTPSTADDDSAAPKATLNALLAGMALFFGGALLL